MNYDKQGFVTAGDGTRLFFGERGEGPAVVLCDGIGCDGFAWKYLQPHLAHHYRVIHPHYRGHGRSGPPLDPARLDIQSIAHDVLRVLQHLEVEHAVWLGHSMGTQVVLEAYRLAPARVAAMVLLCGSFGKITHTFHGNDLLRQVLPPVIEAAQKHRGWARALWGRIPAKLAFRVASWSREVDALAIREEDFRWYWNHVSVMDPDVFLRMLEHAGEHTAEDLLPEVDVPAIVIAGDQDTFTPYELAEYMAQQLPKGELATLAGGSHAAPVEQPDAIANHIDDFLRRALRPEATGARAGE